MLHGWPKHHGMYETSSFTVLNKNPVGCPVSLKECSFICLEIVPGRMIFFLKDPVARLYINTKGEALITSITCARGAAALYY